MFEIDITPKIGAIFKIEKFKEDGSVTWRSEPITNIMLNTGLVSLQTYSMNAMMAYINIGSGTTTPVSTDTGLTNRLYSTNVTQVALSNVIVLDPWHVSSRKIFQFNIGTCTGTFGELGLSRTNNGEYLNKALFKDSNGNSITITVAANEGLRISVDMQVTASDITKIFSQKYKLDLKGATAGGITFTNGTNSRTVTLANIKATSVTTIPCVTEPPTGNGNFYSELNTYIYTGNDKIQFAYTDTDSTIHILFLCSNKANANLSIASHTLTGGSGPPELTLTQPFVLAEKKTVNHVHETTGIITPIEYYVHFSNLTASGGRVYGYGACHSGTTAYHINERPYNYTIATLTYAMTGVNTIVTSAAVSPFSAAITKKAYYGPGVLGTGDITVSTIRLDYTFASLELVTPLVIPDIDELTITLTWSWG